MTKAVIIDMDGLLIDSEPAWFLAHQRQHDFLGLPPYTKENARAITGMGHKEGTEYTKKQFGITQDTQEMIDILRKFFYEEFLKNPRVMPGTIDILSALQRNYKLALATGNGPRDKVLEVLEKLKLAWYFSVIITGDEAERGKPAPDIYLLTANKLRFKPSDCLVLEDAVNGVLAAKAADMQVIGVNKDREVQKALQKGGADKVVKSLVELDAGHLL